MDPADQRELPHRRRWIVAVVVRAVAAGFVPLHDLPLVPRSGAGQAQGAHGLGAAARDRDDRHVHRPRPRSVLHLLGDRPGPDVLHDRHLGWTTARVRRGQVLPLHAVRFDLHAAGVPRPLVQHGWCRGRIVRHHRAPATRDRSVGDVPEPSLRRIVPRVRHQGADVAVPHLAAGCPYRGTDRGLRVAGGHHAEDGDLRIHPDRVPDPAGGRQGLRSVDRDPGGHIDHLRRVVLSTRRPTSND